MGAISKAPFATNLRARLALSALLATVAFGAAASPAAAVTYFHPFISTFGPNGTSSTKFVTIDSLAVDQSTHDLYATDFQRGETNKGIVYRFTSSGEPHNFTAGPAAGTHKLTGLTAPYQVAVALPGAAAGTEGDLYVATETGLRIYSPEGALLGVVDGSGNPNPHSLPKGSYPCAVTTDFAGNVYLGFCTPTNEDPLFVYVEKYAPSGDPITNADFDSEITGFTFRIHTNSQIAAGSTRLYVNGGYDLSLFPGGGGSVDVSGKASGPCCASYVDPSNEDLYTVFGGIDNNTLIQTDKGGNPVSILQHPYEIPDSAYGVAVGDSGNVYVANRVSNGENSRVRIYGDGIRVELPTASIAAPSSVTYQSAHLSGTVNAGGSGEAQEATYRFECNPGCPGIQANDFNWRDNPPIPADGADHVVSADTTGLQPETTYEVTLISANRAGEVKDTVSFETSAKPPTVEPSVEIDAVTDFTTTSAHLSGTVNPGGEGETQQTTYRFEYSPDGLRWIPMAERGPIAGGAQEVSEELEGLEPNATYSVRLRAENLGGSDLSDGPDPSFTTKQTPPSAEATSATHVLSTSAQLNGRVNPRGLATSYYFQWGTGDCASNPCTSIPASQDESAGSGHDDLFVKAQLKGLAPGTSYSYRLIAESSSGKTTGAPRSFRTEPQASACPNAALRGGASAALPDCRAYEMVSPLDKNGGNIAGSPPATRVASDGDAVVYASLAGFAGTPGNNDYGALYLGRRGGDGWSARGITPQHETPPLASIFSSSGFTGEFSADLSKGIFRSFTPLPGVTSANVAGVSNLYLGSGFGSAGASMQLISDSATPLAPDNNQLGTGYTPHIGFAGASADFSHIAFESDYNLTPDASGTARKAYEWVDGQVRLAGILPDSACESPPCPAPASVVGGGAAWGFVGGGAGTVTQRDGAVSEDGSRVFFTAGALGLGRGAGGSSRVGDLYVRENGALTRQIDASERSRPVADSGWSEFGWATPDGSRVFFISGRHLTDDDNDAGEGSEDLYEYDFGAPVGQRLTLITPELRFPEGLRVFDVIGASKDGSFVYFLGRAPESSSLPQGIYVLHDGSVRLVGVKGEVPGIDEQAAVSPDGRHFLFTTYDDQGLGYDNHAPPPESGYRGTNCALSGAEYGQDKQPKYKASCTELYLYSYDSDTLECVSCNPSGAPPVGNASFIAISYEVANQVQNLPQHPLSEDGRYAFFDSLDALVPEDTNGKIDVYVYDSVEGEISLISSGQCNCDSYFDGASPDGEDVFFVTKEQLVLKDADNLYDLYDARVGGGIAAQNQLPPQECEGDACQGAPSAPLDPTPASAGLSGAGNPPLARKKPRSRRCAKVKRRVRAHCVKRKTSTSTQKPIGRRGRRG